MNEEAWDDKFDFIHECFLILSFVVVIITILVIVACILGVKWKKSSEMKDKGRAQE
ncbi:hypothetical protein [Kineothrix sp. MB12-C1]|uniref:hypothetical protein n=1 Tax=Kineothrix sp. MB12-C1 TaxID=3070215 RepID=UPI0027D34A8C|nr:hypothetical protein [Kineothrix sp. MB12-C1]WMC92730.1 hypothetical protein RBB56_00110 [Kineothrix sp. MB12-C1]